MTHNPSSSSFDIATAALEHLELLNSSNLNPLAIAAQFRTLLRRKKSSTSTAVDSTYTDYMSTDVTNRQRQRRARPLSEQYNDARSKSLSRIQYVLDENLLGHSHLSDIQSCTDKDNGTVLSSATQASIHRNQTTSMKHAFRSSCGSKFNV
jgi:hypothetical protein